MQNDNIKLILASGSPRRLELLRQAGIEPEVCAADVQELTDSLPPAELVQRNAELKAWAVAARQPLSSRSSAVGPTSRFPWTVGVTSTPLPPAPGS